MMPTGMDLRHPSNLGKFPLISRFYGVLTLARHGPELAGCQRRRRAHQRVWPTLFYNILRRHGSIMHSLDLTHDGIIRRAITVAALHGTLYPHMGPGMVHTSPVDPGALSNGHCDIARAGPIQLAQEQPSARMKRGFQVDAFT